LSTRNRDLFLQALKTLLSMGEWRAMLIFGPDYLSTGAAGCFLKKRIGFREMMERFPV